MHPSERYSGGISIMPNHLVNSIFWWSLIPIKIANLVTSSVSLVLKFRLVLIIWFVFQGFIIAHCQESEFNLDLFYICDSIAGWEVADEILQHIDSLVASQYSDSSKIYQAKNHRTYLDYSFDPDQGMKGIEQSIKYFEARSELSPYYLLEALYCGARLMSQKRDYIGIGDYILLADSIFSTQPIPENGLTALINYYLGEYYWAVGDLGKNLEYSKKALETSRMDPRFSSLSLGKTYSGVALAYLDLDQGRKAAQYFSYQLDIFQKKYGHDSPKLAMNYLNLAVAYDRSGNYEKSIDTGKRAAALARQRNTPSARHELFTILNNLSYAYRQIDSLHLASEMHEQAWHLLRSLEFDRKYYMLFQHFLQGNAINRKLQRFDQAMNYLNRLEDIVYQHFPDEGDRWTTLYYEQFLLYRDMEDITEAARILDKFSANLQSKIEGNPGGIGNHYDLIKLHWSYAEYFSLRDKLLGDQFYLDSTIYHLFQAFEEIKFVRQAHSDPLDRIQAVSDYDPVIKDLVDNLWIEYQMAPSSKIAEMALEVSEQSKGLLLADQIWASSRELSTALPSTVVDEKSQLLANRSAIRNELNVLESDKERLQVGKIRLRDSLTKISERLDQLNDSIARYFPLYAPFTERQKKAVFDQYKLHSGEGALVLEYFVSHDVIYLFELTPDSVNFHRVGDASVLSDIEAFNSGISDKNRNMSRDSLALIAERIYSKIVGPHIYLGQKRNMIIVPDGPLNLLPFDALFLLINIQTGQVQTIASLTHQTMKTTYQKGRADPGFQIQCVGIAPMTSSYNLSPEAIDLFDDSYAMVLRDQDLHLPYSATEVNNIQDLMGGEVLLGDEASEKNIRQKIATSGIIHFATHAFVDDQDPESSNLLLSRSESEGDGVLDMSEILDLRLHAEMLVLSACQTGFGPIRGGEGVLSLAHAFNYAGAQSTVMSLWKIPDLSAAKIMTAFYQGLSKGLPKNEALQKAKLHYLQTTTEPELLHPFYWAGYRVDGDVSPLSFVQKKVSWSLWLALSTLVIVIYLLLRKYMVGI